jgi:hypothetical protein
MKQTVTSPAALTLARIEACLSACESVDAETLERTREHVMTFFEPGGERKGARGRRSRQQQRRLWKNGCS